jgi:hypothetical protein
VAAQHVLIVPVAATVPLWRIVGCFLSARTEQLTGPRQKRSRHRVAAQDVQIVPVAWPLSVAAFSFKNRIHPRPILWTGNQSRADGIEVHVQAMGIKVFMVSNAMFKKVALKRHTVRSGKITFPALNQLRDITTQMRRYHQMQMIRHQEEHVNCPFI